MNIINSEYIFNLPDVNIWTIGVFTILFVVIFCGLIRFMQIDIYFQSKSRILNKINQAVCGNDVMTIIKLIQKYPEYINKCHPVDGLSPFMRVCLRGNTQLVNFMLQHGADIKTKSHNGETPFYLAAFNLILNHTSRDASCIRILFYAGSDINASNKKGYTALHLAAVFGHASLVSWLLSKGASSVIRPFPYVLARMQGHYETAKILKNNGLPAIE